VSAPSRLPLIAGDPPELLVHDEPITCPYLPDETARLPLRLPIVRLTRAQLDQRLAQGERRQGRLVYTTACPRCHACEAIRIPVRDFRPSRGQRRVWRRGQAEIESEIGEVQADPGRVWLYNRHKALRGLDRSSPITLEGYRVLLADSPCESFEIRYSVAGELAGIAIVDRAERGLSAVYCCYDPLLSRLSLGTYSILYQIELCRAWGLDHLYLGLTIDRCRAMVYKQRFFPHERLIDEQWRVFEDCA
jgi:arginine-tRNA-protein transferase